MYTCICICLMRDAIYLELHFLLATAFKCINIILKEKKKLCDSKIKALEGNCVCTISF